MISVLLVAIGGGAGSSVRYLLALACARIFDSSYPLGTFAANLLGCLAIGVLGSVLTGPAALRDEYRLLLIVGFLGGFTTFSSFAWETVGLATTADLARAAAYVVLSNGLGILGVAAGMKLCGRL